MLHDRGLLPRRAAGGWELVHTTHLHTLATRMPNGRAEIFDGVGHLVHMEATDRFNARMLDFLDGH